MIKLEQAARQALDALEELFHSNSTKVAVQKYNTAHTALREALSEQEDEIDWIETNKALAKEIIKLKKQTEQEPVGEMIDKNGYKGAAWYLEPPVTGTKLYAAPVRTKDLTDVDLWNLWEKSDSNIEFARAVIAADREKNNV